MSETPSKNKRADLSAIKPGHPIWEEVWKRCSPDADDHASHLDQLFESKLQREAMRSALEAIVAVGPPVRGVDELWSSWQARKFAAYELARAALEVK